MWHEALQVGIDFPEVSEYFPNVALRRKRDLLIPDEEDEVRKCAQLGAICADMPPAVERMLHHRRGTAGYHYQGSACIEDGVALVVTKAAYGRCLTRRAVWQGIQVNISQARAPVNIVEDWHASEDSVWLVCRICVFPGEVAVAARVLTEADREGLELKVLSEAIRVAGVLRDLLQPFDDFLHLLVLRVMLRQLRQCLLRKLQVVLR
mmetsp:Transcript_5458/g.12463  ORF Transcript_5458/g.12463 Transcript_5458/m.12463 type:complete len:207 (+) Transcript_5458:253-873(+)